MSGKTCARGDAGGVPRVKGARSLLMLRSLLAFGVGYARFEAPVFAKTCRNVTHNISEGARFVVNVSTVCTEDAGAYDTGGFFRRAPWAALFAWEHDVLAVGTADGQVSAVRRGQAARAGLRAG